MAKLKVIDKNSEYFGQELDGEVFYFDIAHTGESDDLYVAETKDGKSVNLLTSQIDEEYYKEQKLAEFIKELGANVGDSVEILEAGSGIYSYGWNKEGIHKIVKIGLSGVVFDNGDATIVRPRVRKVEI